MSDRKGLRFCIVGGDGAIGFALNESLREKGIESWSSTRNTLVEPTRQFSIDLRGNLSDFSMPECDVVVLAAAITGFSACRADPESARRVNVGAQIELAKQALAHGSFVAFLSTNQVFDGTIPHVAPEQARSPRSIYGKLKAEAETELLLLGRELAVIRLTKVIGRHLSLFERWRQQLLSGRVVNAFSDLVMAPIAMNKVVVGIEKICLGRLGGIWHLGGSEDINYVDAARHIAGRLGSDEKLIQIASAAAAGIPENERPAHTVLDPGDIVCATGVQTTDARTELDLGLGLTEVRRYNSPTFK